MTIVKSRTARGMYSSGVKVEYLGGTKVAFVCPKGHREVIDYSKLPVSKRLSESAIKMFIPYWQERVSMTCKKCKKEVITR